MNMIIFIARFHTSFIYNQVIKLSIWLSIWELKHSKKIKNDAINLIKTDRGVLIYFSPFHKERNISYKIAGKYVRQSRMHPYMYVHP